MNARDEWRLRKLREAIREWRRANYVEDVDAMKAEDLALDLLSLEESGAIRVVIRAPRRDRP